MIQKLARHWMTDYDWRKCEANPNALSQPEAVADVILPAAAAVDRLAAAVRA